MADGTPTLYPISAVYNFQGVYGYFITLSNDVLQVGSYAEQLFSGVPATLVFYDYLLTIFDEVLILIVYFTFS
jgi:hypothetical protein